MASGIDWFRWHHGSVTDQKFQLVAHRASASVAEVIAVWATALEAASMSDERGNPGDLDCESIDCALGMNDGTASRIIGAMSDRGLFTEDGRIASWEKRQPKRERENDNSTSRVRAFRERQTNETPCATGHEHETPCNATERTETPREEKRREEKKRKEKEQKPGARPVEIGDIPQLQGLDANLLADWKALRKQKRAPITQTAIDGIEREAQKAGISLHEALRMCCERGWSGFNAEWIVGKQSPSSRSRTHDGYVSGASVGLLGRIL